MEYSIIRSDEHLAHHGIKGQKWGVRRFQNEDGSYTAEGAKRYGAPDYKTEKLMKRVAKIDKLDWREKRDALKKLSKDKKFKELVDDKDLKTKRESFKKAEDEWFNLSKGEDFDAYDEKTGYDNYGITPKEFRKIMALDSKRVLARDELFKATQKKVETFTSNYVNQPLSKMKLSSDEQNRINKLLTVAALKG